MYSIYVSLNPIFVISATSLKWDFTVLHFNFAYCQFSNTCISRDGCGVLKTLHVEFQTHAFSCSDNLLYSIIPQKGFLSVDHSARRSQQESGSLIQHYFCFVLNTKLNGLLIFKLFFMLTTSEIT